MLPPLRESAATSLDAAALALGIMGEFTDMDKWIEIWQNGRPSHYWNRLTSTTSQCHVPVTVTWAGAQDTSSGRFYFWQPGNPSIGSVWQLPPLSAREAPEKLPKEFETRPFSVTEPAGETCSADDAWVKIAAAVPYYWNVKLGVTSSSLPAGKQAKWSSHRKHDDWYFLHIGTGNTYWELPQGRCQPFPASEALSHALCASVDRWLQLGAPVQIVNLKRQARFNNQVGVVIEAAGDRLMVRLPEDCFGTVLAVQPHNVRPLAKGSLVELFGLSRTDFNGRVGTVEDSEFSGNPSILRYTVKLGEGSVKSFKAANLKPRSRLWELGSVITVGRRATRLQWRDERSITFIDRNSHHRRFWLHLPIGFNPTPLRTEQAGGRYPLLVFMHGAGGGTLFTNNQKFLGTSGIQFAANRFVVISPECHWTWKESPGRWVIELIEEWRALDWIDYRRIYLTGLSMGGMAVWELATMRPDLFAAVSLVAAHHKQEHSQKIAEHLVSTPVYAVHDETDVTCPLAPEAELWRRMVNAGNRQITICLKNGVGHCGIFDHAYCRDDDLYRWLLQYPSGPPYTF